jgi:hypothetical protein
MVLTNGDLRVCKSLFSESPCGTFFLNFLAKSSIVGTSGKVLIFSMNQIGHAFFASQCPSHTRAFRHVSASRAPKLDRRIQKSSLPLPSVFGQSVNGEALGHTMTLSARAQRDMRSLFGSITYKFRICWCTNCPYLGRELRRSHEWQRLHIESG